MMGVMNGRRRTALVVVASLACAAAVAGCAASPATPRQGIRPVTGTTQRSGRTTTTVASGTTSPGPSGFLAHTASVQQATTSDGLADCGGAVLEKPDGTPWVCTFDDEFDGTTLNPQLWTAQTTATTGYRSGDECYTDTPQTVSVSGGVLSLTAVRMPAPFVCQSPAGDYTTQYISGTVTSYDKFSQAYGYFEVKARFPGSRVPGLQSSLWLWPENRNAYGPVFPDSGEIDFAEWFSADPQLAIPTVHYNAASGQDFNATSNQCVVANPAKFNTYGVIWTAQTLTFLIDGQKCLVDNWFPASPQVKPAPFNLPFFLNLTQALGLGANAPSSKTVLPATMQVDWVRVWR
jgi:beta-glucanase (GH16 family)